MRVVIVGASISGMMASVRFPKATLIEAAGPTSVAPVLASTFYAHQRVPVFAEQPVTVLTKVLGVNDPRAYAEKVYGDRTLPVSMDTLTPIQQAWRWDFKGVMESLLTQPGRVAWDCPVESIDWHHNKLYTKLGTVRYDALLCSAPLPAVLRLMNPRRAPVVPFKSETIWLRHRQSSELCTAPPDTIVVTYSADPDVPWYRCNHQDNKMEYEYTDRAYRTLSPSMRTGMIPLRPGKLQPHPIAAEAREVLAGVGIHLIGRYARWEQKWLSHQTWEQLQAMLQAVVL